VYRRAWRGRQRHWPCQGGRHGYDLDDLFESFLAISRIVADLPKVHVHKLHQWVVNFPSAFDPHLFLPKVLDAFSTELQNPLDESGIEKGVPLRRLESPHER
jgi:hypothetical protein